MGRRRATIRTELPSSNGGASDASNGATTMSMASRFADQGYLDSFSAAVAARKVIENVGANLAPWNIANYRIDFRDGQVMIDADQSADLLSLSGPAERACGGSSSTAIASSVRRFHATIRDHIYRPYVDELLAIEKIVDPCSTFRCEAAPPIGGHRYQAYHQEQGTKCRHAAFSSCWIS